MVSARSCDRARWGGSTLGISSAKRPPFTGTLLNSANGAPLLSMANPPTLARAGSAPLTVPLRARPAKTPVPFDCVPVVWAPERLIAAASSKESFGLAALEAMACEVPVVAARAGGIPEVVEDGVTGVLAEVGDVDSMAHAALNILRNRELYTRMGQAARRRAVEHFHPSLIVPHYLDAYTELLK